MQARRNHSSHNLHASAVIAVILALAAITVQAAQSPSASAIPRTAISKQAAVHGCKSATLRNASSVAAQPKCGASNNSADLSHPASDQIAILKRQLAAQQQQIQRLARMVEALQRRSEVEVQEPQTEAATSSGANQITSLVPVLPTSKQSTGAADSLSLPKLAASDPHASTTAAQESKSGPVSLDQGKVKIGATFFGFYRYFTQTGFGPQTLDNTDIHPGPGNDGFNEFNVNRTYINIFYSPTDTLTFRVTPDIYREVGGATAEKLSNTSAIGSSLNGNLGFRLKYAYVDFDKPFAHSKVFSKDKLTFGQTQQPLTDWEENLYGYRFVNLTPWNYLSLSSTFPGVRLHGPIELHGKQYLDYDIGIFNNSSFHAYEAGDRKQVMARLSYYPFGAVSQYQGLGLTGFVDYGYKDAAPDQNINMPITRVAALVHYTTKSNDYGIAGEYDYGRNAFSLGNLFSGSGPADAFGLGPTRYATFNALAGALLGGTRTKQQGFDVFGHARIAKSPLYVFGMFEQFNPNTNVRMNPLDFRTVIGGISYKYGKYWQFALDSQNIIYYHKQFTFPASQLATFSSSLAASNPGGIPNAVPGNTNAIFFNVLFNY